MIVRKPEAGFKAISTVHSDESKPNRWQLREIHVNFHFRFNKTNFMRAGWGLDNLFEGDAGSYTFLGLLLWNTVHYLL